MDAATIARTLREIGEYLDLDGDPYRARAYRRAAESVELAPDVAGLAAAGRLAELPGVGASLSAAIAGLARGESSRVLGRLIARWPRAALELSRLPGVGPVRARRIADALAPRSLEEVAELCERGAVRALRGFGRVSEARILEAIRARERGGALMLLPEARRLGAALAAHLRADPATARAEPCGPARRWQEIVEHVALAVETRAAGPAAVEAVRERLERLPLVASARVEGPRLVVARLESGMRCEVHVAPPGLYGAALVLATGSRAHVAELRALAHERGAALEELRADDEAELYRALGLAPLPPEVRDGTDEIEAALQGPLQLVERADVRGAVHCHTLASDGRNTIEEMAEAARARGLEYLTVTDHSAAASYANGLSVERLREQAREIAALRDPLRDRLGVRVLSGTEADILADGAIDFPRGELERLDVVVASVHRRHALDEAASTRRLVAAMRQPLFKVWGHPLGRLLLRRPPIPCRFEEVADAIADSPAAIELNGDPRRLDLEPALARLAAERGARFVLSSDAHSLSDLDNLEYAVALARRARLRRADVLNALPAEEFARAVRPRRAS